MRLFRRARKRQHITVVVNNPYPLGLTESMVAALVKAYGSLPPDAQTSV